MPTAYLTGGASGLGKATAEMLVRYGIKVFIADINPSGAEAVVDEFNKTNPGIAQSAQVDVADWNSQAKAFGQAVHALGRIDYVYAIAGIGERKMLSNDPNSTGFEAPDLTVLDVDLKGVLYTASLAITQMRRQEPDSNGFRGKIGVIASVCGFYCCPTLPVYTAAKHGVVGFVRSFGKYLPEEKITLNAVCPNVIRTNISTPQFYDKMEEKGFLVPIEAVPAAFEYLLGATSDSGECFEVGPNYKTQGVVKTRGPPFLDDESAESFELLYHRGRPLHQPQ